MPESCEKPYGGFYFRLAKKKVAVNILKKVEKSGRKK